VSEIIHQYISFYSFVMGVLWFSFFVLLGLLMRKLKFFVRFSAIPLLLLLVLSVFRMLIAVDIPASLIVNSEILYPAILDVLRFEIISQINVTDLLIFVWVAGAAYLLVRYALKYNGYNHVIKIVEGFSKDEYAESLLAELVGTNKKFRVYRNAKVNIPIAITSRAYIVLPDIVFTPEELKVILLHEWKHIVDRDHLSEVVISIICCIFWWNPLVYLLKENFSFARELKCDYFAVSTPKDLDHYNNGFKLVYNNKKQKIDCIAEGSGVSSFIRGDYETYDRLKVLALRERSKSPIKQFAANTIFSVVIGALFLASYMVIILPAHWESPYDSMTMEEFMDEGEGVFRPDEVFIVDNGDGTFSLFVDGHFVSYMDVTSENFNFFPMREK